MVKRSDTKYKPSARKLVVNTSKSKKWFAFGGTVLTFLIGSFAAYSIYSHFNNKPEKVLTDAFTNTFEDLTLKESLTFNGWLNLDIKGDRPLKLSITPEGSIDKNNGYIKSQISITHKEEAHTFGAELVFDGDEALYFKLDNLKPTLQKLGEDIPEVRSLTKVKDQLITKLEGKWVKVNKSDVQNLSNIDDAKIQQCTQAFKNLKLKKSDKKQLKNLFEQNQPLRIVDYLKSEDVNGATSYHYKLNFNSENAAKFKNAALEKELFHEVRDSCIFESKDNKSMRQPDNTNSFTPNIELWVNKKTRTINKVRINIDNNQTTFNFELNSAFKDQKTDINLPKEWTAFSDLRQEFDIFSQ